MFVRQADEAVTLRRTLAGIAYLDHAELERALLESKADAVWVGWGFVAEDIAFAELCARLKLTFIGPPPVAMRTLGDKVEAKLLAEKVDVPLAPWSGGPVQTREDARRRAEEVLIRNRYAKTRGLVNKMRRRPALSSLSWFPAGRTSRADRSARTLARAAGSRWPTWSS